MKFKKLIIFSFFLIISIASSLWISKHVQSNEAKKNNVKDNPYFISVPIIKFNEIQAPCVMVEIESKSISAMVDLGFRGAFSVSKEILQDIKNKKYLDARVKYGAGGKPYSIDSYRIPKIYIGRMGFSNPKIEEEKEEMHKEAVFSRDGSEPSPPEPATLGWEIFGDVNLFMDFQNSIIAFCDSFETLVKQGYSPDTFVKAPLLLERGLIEFIATTPKGPLRCMVDTGSTWNILNIPNEENRSFRDLIWDPKNRTQFPDFTIGNKDFGSVTFRGLPILLPIHIEAVLGMDFLMDHLVFIDFANKQIYFAPSK